MSDFDKLSSYFLSGFKAQPGASFHSDLSITDLRSRNAGRGIIATADIPADTDLFVIPRDYGISVETSELRQKLPSLFATEDDNEDEMVEDAEDAMTELPKPWLDLILVLLYEYFHREDHASSRSTRWKAYWDVLPEDFNTLMFWSENEMSALQASASRGKVGKDTADRMFRRKILPVVTRHEDVFYPEDAQRLGEKDLLILAHRMGSLIMAYAFDLENEKGDEEDEEGEDGWAEDREGTMAMGMVPMADMLNADAEFNAHLEHGEKELTMKSLRLIKKGEEVLNYYGPLPNSDLLRRYGYTSAKHARYDVVEISWDLITKSMEDVLGSLPAVEVEEGELEESFVLERESGDPDETGLTPTVAKFTTFPEELVDQITIFVSAKLGIKGRPNEDQKKTLKRTFLQIMEKTLPARLAEYGTTIEEDEDLLRQESIIGRIRMAIDVRIGEKRLLREAQQLLAELLVKYSQVQQNGSIADRPSKRQKTGKQSTV